MPRGLRHVALSISFLSPIVRRPDAFAVTKIASLIFRPERRFLALTSFQSLRRPSLRLGSSSLISLRSLYRFLARACALRETSKVHRAFVLRAAPVRVSQPPVSRISPFPISTIYRPTVLVLNSVQKHNEGRLSWRPLSF